MKTLYWTADSPYCRIVLWSIFHWHLENDFQFQHLTWNELRAQSMTPTLGPSGTVPCLISREGQPVSDSLRILATLMPESIGDWLLSDDGEFYRMAEGQFSRILYAIYDRAPSEPPKPLREQWKRALSGCQLFLSSERAGRRLPEDQSLSHPLGFALSAILIHFCVHFLPTWNTDLSPDLMQRLKRLQQHPASLKLRAQIEKHPHRVAYGFLGTSGSEGSEAR